MDGPFLLLAGNQTALASRTLVSLHSGALLAQALDNVTASADTSRLAACGPDRKMFDFQVDQVVGRYAVADNALVDLATMRRFELTPDTASWQQAYSFLQGCPTP